MVVICRMLLINLKSIMLRRANVTGMPVQMLSRYARGDSFLPLFNLFFKATLSGSLALVVLPIC
jgi:hypothetical protein